MERHRFVWGRGPVPCEVVIIGEAPGAQEERLGIPFVGRSGKILDDALELAGLKDEAYLTNIYKFRPPKNRTPTRDEISWHRGFLINELVWHLPSYVLLLGNTALEAFTGFGGISSRRGLLEKGPTIFYATYHPSATLYNPSFKEDFYNDIEDFANLVERAYTATY